jgi:hypothetical protein
MLLFQEFKEKKVKLVHKDPQAQKVLEAKEEFQAKMVRMDHKVPKALKEILVEVGEKGMKVLQANTQAGHIMKIKIKNHYS